MKDSIHFFVPPIIMSEIFNLLLAKMNVSESFVMLSGENKEVSSERV